MPNYNNNVATYRSGFAIIRYVIPSFHLKGFQTLFEYGILFDF